MTQTSRSGSPARPGARGKRFLLLYVAIAFVAVIIAVILVLVLSGGEQTGDGTGRDQITTTGQSDVVTAPGRSDR
ncbi:hypothetical protein JL107_14815 [Nakamurella flavida]|uniref:Uncharacterized protein n=1 Tax=Nakamurella flavida TaxID=363630 RepID=A0A939C447_9ACTN|nr:hypothetical protein [Nakamurella flavida]MBM9477721.1 hypothetical protein [Nakamurella flavida]MDP9779273.1 hypothetical protein [Nakamurella flavida]